jgi:hypothetical protein
MLCFLLLANEEVFPRHYQLYHITIFDAYPNYVPPHN